MELSFILYLNSPKQFVGCKAMSEVLSSITKTLLVNLFKSED